MGDQQPVWVRRLIEQRFAEMSVMNGTEDTNWTHLAIEMLNRRWAAMRACGGGPDSNEQLIDDIRYWMAGVGCSVLAVFGLLGNLLSFFTIVSMKRRSLFNNLLLTLTISDFVFLVNGGLFFVQRAFEFQSDLYNTLFPQLIYPLAGIAMTVSTYTCIAIALERYLGICHSQSDFVIRRSPIYIALILLVSLLIDLPRFVEIEPWKANTTGFKYTNLRKNHTYITFYTLWFRLIATLLVPFLLMLVFNLKILVYYKQNSFGTGRAGRCPSPRPPRTGGLTRNPTLRASASAPVLGAAAGPEPAGNPGLSSQERTLYITFFCLTTTFVVCHLPRILLNVHELHMNEQRRICRTEHGRKYRSSDWLLIAASVEKLLLIFNASINFVYYCLVGKTFRQHMCKTLFGNCFVAGSNRGNNRNALSTAGPDFTTSTAVDSQGRVSVVRRQLSEEAQQQLRLQHELVLSKRGSFEIDKTRTAKLVSRAPLAETLRGSQGRLVAIIHALEHVSEESNESIGNSNRSKKSDRSNKSDKSRNSGRSDRSDRSNRSNDSNNDDDLSCNCNDNLSCNSNDNNDDNISNDSNDSYNESNDDVSYNESNDDDDNTDNNDNDREAVFV